MKSAAGTVVLLWSVLLAALAVMLWIWSPGDELAIAVLGGSAVAAALLGTALELPARRSVSEPPLRILPDLSLSTVAIAVALSTMLIGAAAGLWLVAIGAGLLAFGVGGLIRERRRVHRS